MLCLYPNESTHNSLGNRKSASQNAECKNASMTDRLFRHLALHRGKYFPRKCGPEIKNKRKEKNNITLYHLFLTFKTSEKFQKEYRAIFTFSSSNPS